MATDVGRQTRSVIEKLIERPQSFDLFQAIRLLEYIWAQQPYSVALTRLGDPEGEPVRLTATMDLKFHASAIESFQPAIPSNENPFNWYMEHARDACQQHLSDVILPAEWHPQHDRFSPQFKLIGREPRVQLDFVVQHLNAFIQQVWSHRHALPPITRGVSYRHQVYAAVRDALGARFEDSSSPFIQTDVLIASCCRALYGDPRTHNPVLHHQLRRLSAPWPRWPGLDGVDRLACCSPDARINTDFVLEAIDDSLKRVSGWPAGKPFTLNLRVDKGWADDPPKQVTVRCPPSLPEAGVRWATWLNMSSVFKQRWRFAMTDRWLTERLKEALAACVGWGPLVEQLRPFTASMCELVRDRWKCLEGSDTILAWNASALNDPAAHQATRPYDASFARKRLANVTASVLSWMRSDPERPEPDRWFHFDAEDVFEAVWPLVLERYRQTELPDSLTKEVITNALTDALAIHLVPARSFFSQARVGPGRLQVNTISLAGSVGPLPNIVTELIQAQRHAEEPPGSNVLTDFLDIFHHRLIGLLYAIHRSLRMELTRLPPSRSFLGHGQLAFGGLDLTSQQAGLRPVELEALMASAAYLSPETRPTIMLVDLLSMFLMMEANVVPFRGRWFRHPHQTRLGDMTPSTSLGLGATLGEQVWLQDAAVDVVLGPMSWEQLLSLFPSRADGEQRGLFDEVKALIELFLDHTLCWDLIAQVSDPVGCSLARDEGTQRPAKRPSVNPGKLGWSTFLGFDPKTPPATSDVLLHQNTPEEFL